MDSEKFFKEVNEAFARLKADPDAWAEELAERKLWDNTLSDGQTDEIPGSDSLLIVSTGMKTPWLRGEAPPSPPGINPDPTSAGHRSAPLRGHAASMPVDQTQKNHYQILQDEMDDWQQLGEEVWHSLPDETVPA